jgi:hypothetical protein
MKLYGLQKDSVSYYINSAIYEKLSQAEDYPGKIAKLLISLTKGKKLLMLDVVRENILKY